LVNETCRADISTIYDTFADAFFEGFLAGNSAVRAYIAIPSEHRARLKAAFMHDFLGYCDENFWTEDEVNGVRVSVREEALADNDTDAAYDSGYESGQIDGHDQAEGEYQDKLDTFESVNSDLEEKIEELQDRVMELKKEIDEMSIG